MLRKKAVGLRTKPTLSDIFPFINRIVYIELCSLHAVIGGLLVNALPYFDTTFKNGFPLEEWNGDDSAKYK